MQRAGNIYLSDIDRDLPRLYFAVRSPAVIPVECSPGATKKDGKVLVLAAVIITGLRARDPRAGCLNERVIDAVEDVCASLPKN